MAAFLDLDSNEVEELGISSQFEGPSFVVNTGSQVLFSVAHEISVDQPRDVSRYLACFCQTGHSAAADFRSIVSKETQKTIGYSFPITTYREPDLLGLWPARFAEVGFRRLLSLEILDKFSKFRTVESLREREELFLDTIFPDDLSVLVLGIEQVKQSKFSIEELQLVLHSVGVWVSTDSLAPRPIRNSDNESPGSYRLGRVSQLMRSDVTYFLKLFRDADGDNSEVGRFITYYQVVEYCIEKVFSWCVANVASQKLTTWELRERLGDASSEKKRIGILISDCLDSTWGREASKDLAESCRELLDAIGETYVEDEQWGHLLYRVRGIIVHNQFRLLRSNKVQMIQQVNYNLRRVCFGLVTSFKQGI